MACSPTDAFRRGRKLVQTALRPDCPVDVDRGAARVPRRGVIWLLRRAEAQVVGGRRCFSRRVLPRACELRYRLGMAVCMIYSLTIGFKVSRYSKPAMGQGADYDYKLIHIILAPTATINC